MTDGVWQGGSVMSTPRRGPCRASRHDRGRRKTPRVSCLTLPYRRAPALVYSRRNATCLAWLSATSATSRCEACSGVPAATCTRYRRRPVRGTLRRRGISADAWNLAAPWNIAVRTRGVFTHRAGFQKPACAEMGLVRTVIGSDQAAVPRFLTITQFPKKSIRS